MSEDIKDASTPEVASPPPRRAKRHKAPDPEPVQAAVSPPQEAAVTPEAPTPRGEVTPAPVRFYRVRVAKRVCIRGGFTSLHAGKLLDVRSYGDTVIRSLREQGVELDPVS